MKHKDQHPVAPAPAPQSAGQPAPASKPKLPTALTIGLILAIASPWLALGAFRLLGRIPAGQTPPVVVQREGLGAIKPATHRISHGPWGTLKIEPIIVEPPSAFFGFDYDSSPSRRWILSNATPEQARALLGSAGFDQAAIETVARTATADSSNNWLILHPPDDIVRRMSPELRAAWYAELGKNPANVFHATPFRFRGATIHEWFANSGLSDDIINKIQPLIYKRQRALYFSDLHLVLPEIASPLERIRLLQALYRAATYSIHLQTKPGDSLDAMLAYWGRGGRQADIEPILKSMHKPAEEKSLDVAYLLPSFARTRLYTYINPTRGDPTVRRDCHWTTFNFFNDIPDERYGRLTDLTEVTAKEYEGINSPMEFGDVIFFIVPPQSAIHSCVYIADDIVFTKNGIGFGMPFVFERLEDVIADFREDFGPFSVQYCRRRGLSN